jgi:hypothetical protein
MKRHKNFGKKREPFFRVLTKLWPTADLMDDELLIDLEKQSVTKRKTNHTYIPQLSGKCKYPQINYSRQGKLIRLLLHNVLFYHKHRYLPEEIDHIDFNPLNNNIDNLRPLTMQENRYYGNKRKFIKGKKTSSKHIGVALDKKQIKLKTNKIWRARVRIPKNHPDFLNEKAIELHLGFYETEDEAGRVVNENIIKYNLEHIFKLNTFDSENEK